MFTKKYFIDLAERVIATMAQVYLAVETVTDLDWGDKLQVMAVGGLASIAKGLIAVKVGASNTAALLPIKEDTQLG